jgi:hypothetical protein
MGQGGKLHYMEVSNKPDKKARPSLEMESTELVNSNLYSRFQVKARVQKNLHVSATRTVRSHLPHVENVQKLLE